MVPGEPPPSDPSAQAWRLPSGQALGTLWCQGPGSSASSEARTSHLEIQTSCLREGAAQGSRGGKKMLGLVVRPRELRAQAVRGLGSVSPQKNQRMQRHMSG